MAVDYGSRATGIAISDELRITVRPLTTLLTDRGKSKSTIDRIVALAHEYNVATVVVGLPLRLDGTKGEAAALVGRFVKRLQERLTVPVVMQDERLTSRAADERLREQGADMNRRRLHSDQIAAAILLEDYLLDSERRKNSARDRDRTLKIDR